MQMSLTGQLSRDMALKQSGINILCAHPVRLRRLCFPSRNQCIFSLHFVECLFDYNTYRKVIIFIDNNHELFVLIAICNVCFMIISDDDHYSPTCWQLCFCASAILTLSPTADKQRMIMEILNTKLFTVWLDDQNNHV